MEHSNWLDIPPGAVRMQVNMPMCQYANVPIRCGPFYWQQSRIWFLYISQTLLVLQMARSPIGGTSGFYRKAMRSSRIGPTKETYINGRTVAC